MMASEVGAWPWPTAPESMFDHAAASCEPRIRQPASKSVEYAQRRNMHDVCVVRPPIATKMSIFTLFL